VDWNTGNLAVHDLLAGENQNLTDEGTWDEPNQYAEASFWSADSRQLAYMWEKEGVWELRIVRLDDPAPRVVYRAEGYTFVYPLAWSSDSKYVVAQLKRKNRTHQLVLIAVADGAVQVLKELGLHSPHMADFSPDGQYVVYDRSVSVESSQHDMFLIRIDDQRETGLLEHPAHDYYPFFTPDGQWIVFLSDRSGQESIWGLPIEGDQEPGEPVMIKPNVGRIKPLGFTRNGAYYYGLSASRTNIYAAAFDPETCRADGEPTKAVQQYEGSNWAATWSPDGKNLAYFSRRIFGQSASPTEVLVVRSAESGRERIFSPHPHRFARLPGLRPRWHADGKSVLFLGVPREDPRGYYSLDIESGDISPVLDGVRGVEPVFSEDMKKLFYVDVSEAYVRTIVVRDTASGQAKSLFREPVQGPVNLVLSPDGGQLAYSAGDSLRLIPADGGETRLLWKIPMENQLPFSGGVVWTGDGRGLLVAKAKDEASDLVELWHVPVDGSDPHELDLEMPRIRHLQITPDGRRLSFTATTGSRTSAVWVLENALSDVGGANP
jgi:Tol biopolymer transport system component